MIKNNSEIAMITDLFKSYSLQVNPPIIELQNIQHKPIAAIYLNKVNCGNLVISETNNSEKYYLYIDGIAIFFSFFKKIATNK